MAGEQEPRNLPYFQPFATAAAFLSDAEIDRLIAEHAPLLAEAKLGPGTSDPNVRRGQVAFLTPDRKNQWLYERLWAFAQECNRRFFCVDIASIEANVQLGRYGESDRGFYNWHTDFGGYRPLRKLSVSVQLSGPEDYVGGDLELVFQHQPYSAEKARGTFIMFPSFTLHRVSPVTRGTRWSLVAWVVGPRWR